MRLRYVLRKCAKHLERRPDPDTVPRAGIDPCSSALWFNGWRDPPPAALLAAPVAPARTWLLTVGWRKHGLLSRHEGPAVPGS